MHRINNKEETINTECIKCHFVWSKQTVETGIRLKGSDVGGAVSHAHMHSGLLWYNVLQDGCHVA